MPRLYMTPSELQETALGLGLANQISALPSGVIDKLLARSSQRCDSWCERRLQAPGSSALSTNASQWATSISVVSTLTLDNLAELGVVLNPGGGNQETVMINSGGINVTNWASPYPGTLSLASGLQFAHSNGETVQYYFREVSEAGSASSSDPYTEAIQTQAMQLALAHMPPTRTALTRTIFFKSYPIISIQQIEHAFSFDNQFNNINLSIESIVPTEGWARFNVGTVILKEGLVRLTYSGGFISVPEDVKVATSFYFAEEMSQMSNPFGATALNMGKRQQRFDMKNGKSPLVQQAENVLRRYKRII